VPLSLHAILAYAMVALMISALVIGSVPPVRRRFKSVGRWFVIAGAAAFFPLITTGILAHCRHVWTAAAVENSPPNLPWYRLTRDAAAAIPPWQSRSITWHAWLGGFLTAILVVGWLVRDKLCRWLTPKCANALGPVLGIIAFLVLATGYGLARHSPREIQATTLTPPSSDRDWDDPAGQSQSLLPATRAHLFALGLALSSGIALIGLALQPDTKPKTITTAAILTCALLASSIATSLWLTTAWQPARFPSLLRQPRDLAHLLTSLCAILLTAALARTARRHCLPRLAGAFALLLAAHLGLTALILYDGSHRASPLWRFHRPFVQLNS
jgi:hypothetical protein